MLDFEVQFANNDFECVPFYYISMDVQAKRRHGDRQAVRQTGRSRGDRGILLSLCRQTEPPPRPLLLLPSPPSALVARWGIRRRHSGTHICTDARVQADTHTHTPSLLALCRSVSLTLTLLYAAILGSGAWNNPRVRMSVCVRVYVSPDFTLTHAHIHTHNTVRRTHLLSV